MDCSFSPDDRWFAFDDTGRTLAKGFRFKWQAKTWMHERLFPPRRQPRPAPLLSSDLKDPDMAKAPTYKPSTPSTSRKGAIKPGQVKANDAHASTLSSGTRSRLSGMGGC